MQPQGGSNSEVTPQNPTSVNPQTISDLGSKPVVYEPVPLPGERPNVAPANVPHDAPPPPLPPKPAAPVPSPPQPSTPSSDNPVPVGGVAYQPTSSGSSAIPVTPTTPPSSPKPSASLLARFKRPLIIVGVILAALLLVGIIASFTSKKGSKSNKQSSSPGDTTNQNSGPVATAPDGYKVIDRPCFSFAILDTNLSIGSDNICFIIARYGEKGISSLNVYPETKTYATIDDFSSTKKKEYNSQVVSEENVKIDGLDAKKVVETVGPNGQQYVRYYVLTSGKSYKYQQTAITGFEINSFYNDDFSRQVTGKIIDSWKWK